MSHVLDNPAWHALGGVQSAFCEQQGPLRRYPADVAPFAATETAAGRDAIASLLPATGISAFWTREPITAPEGVEILGSATCIQMVLEHYHPSQRRAEMRPLGDADLPQMLDLVRLTQRGPFYPRTHTLGRYLGVFEGERLVAMAGERMKPPAYIEISAVCTHPDHRGRGLAAALMTALIDDILPSGDTPMLHVVSGNAPAIAAYLSLGFVVTGTLEVTLMRPPGGPPLDLPAYMRKG